MINPMDIKVNVKPVFSNRVHSGIWEGPCRVGTPEELDPVNEAKIGREQFKIWSRELDNNLNKKYAEILPPVYLEYDESLVVREEQFTKLESDAHKVDLYLITYRVPGIERFGKAISMISHAPTPLDLVGFYRDIGLDAYMAHDYEEFNKLLQYLHVKKAVANTKILILSATEQVPATVYTSIPDLTGLAQRYGVRNNRISFRSVFDVMEGLDLSSEMKQEVRELMGAAVKNDIKPEWVQQDIKFYHAVKQLMKKYECNAFTTSCVELCASQLPMKHHIVPCLTHSLLKDSGFPTSCEEDLNALMAVMMMMYLTEKVPFMGNPVLVPAGTTYRDEPDSIRQLSVPSIVFDEDVLEIHHSVPATKMDGYDKPAMPFFLGHFTAEGWGTKMQIDMAQHDQKRVTFGRFNRRGTKMIIATGTILASEFREIFCSPAVFYKVDGGVREFRQALAKGGYGHHLAVVYGDYVKELIELGEIVGFEVEHFPRYA